MPAVPWLDMLTGGANHQRGLSSSYHGNLQTQMGGWGWGRSAEGAGVSSQREVRVARPRSAGLKETCRIWEHMLKMCICFNKKKH